MRNLTNNKAKKQGLNANIKTAKINTKSELFALPSIFNIAKKETGLSQFKKKDFKFVSLNSQLTLAQFVSVLKNERKYTINIVIDTMKKVLIQGIENAEFDFLSAELLDKGVFIDSLIQKGMQEGSDKAQIICEYLDTFAPTLSNGDLNTLVKYGIEIESYIHLLKAVAVQKAIKIKATETNDFQDVEKMIFDKLNAQKVA